MDPELERLLRAWEAYDAQEQGFEAERVLALYESSLASVAAARPLQVRPNYGRSICRRAEGALRTCGLETGAVQAADSYPAVRDFLAWRD